MTVSVPRQHSASTGLATVETDPTVELVFFGKAYRFKSSDYPVLAPQFYQRLKKEASYLRQELMGHYQIAIQYLEGDGSFAAFTVDLLRKARSKLSGKQSPQAKDFERLFNELETANNRLTRGTSDDYELLRRTGLEFQRIRSLGTHTASKIRGEIEGRISTAETTVTVLQETEDLSAWLWDQYLKGVSVGSPAKLFAGRVGVIMVRAGARYLGEAAADSTVRQRWREVFAFIRKELPGAVKDFLSDSIKKGFSDPKNPLPWETVAVQLIELEIWFAWRTIDFFAFDAPEFKERGKDPSDEYFKVLADEFPAQIIGSLFAIAGSRVSHSSLDEGKKKLYGKVADSLGVVIGVGVTEFLRVRRLAENQNKEFWDVMASEIGAILYKLVKELAKKMAEGPVQDWMKNKRASEASRDRSNDVTDPKFWRALILAIRLDLGPGAPSAPPAAKPPVISAPASGTSTSKPLGKAPADTVIDQNAKLAVASAVKKTVTVPSKATPAKRPARNQRRVAEQKTPSKNLKAASLRRQPPLKPGMERLSWGNDGGLVIEALVGRATGKRKGYERQMLRSPAKLGISDMERAHAQGRITGHESRYGIRYAPREVNQEYQRLGIEQHIADFQSVKAKDVSLLLRTVVKSHPHPNQKILQEITYTLHAVRNGSTHRLYTAVITVGLDRKVHPPEVTEGVDWEPFLKPLPARPRKR
jgi:hypothetical protein